MRRLLLLLLAPVLALVLVVVLIVSVFTDQSRSNHATTNCDATVGASYLGQADAGAHEAAKLDAEQRDIVGKIIEIGKQRRLPPRAWQIAIQAGATESGLRNVNYGDRDSLGIFQMRPSMGWGTPEQVTDPHYAINKFYDVLLKVPKWDEQRPGDSAQDVERSAFPDRYHLREPMAAHLVRQAGEGAAITPCVTDATLALPPNPVAAGAIGFALAQQGKPYQWGASTAQQDTYDCSSLMNQAYRTAGVLLPRTSREQYHAGAWLPVREAQPGDLVFWAYDPSNPASIHHVAMYLGDGKIVEAQQNGVPVHIRPIKWTEGELVPQAVRPGV